MAEGGDNAAEPSLWLVKQAELTHHGAAVIVDSLASEPVFAIEGEDTAKWEFDASARCRHTSSPRPQVGASNRDLQNDRIARNVPMSYLDRKIGQ